MVEVDVEVDSRGTFCPMPIVQVNKAAKNASSGEVIRLMATDPGSERDVPAWTQKTGHELIEATLNGDTFEFLIRVK